MHTQVTQSQANVGSINQCNPVTVSVTAVKQLIIIGIWPSLINVQGLRLLKHVSSDTAKKCNSDVAS